MNLAEIELTLEQAEAFLALLNERVAHANRLLAQEEDEQQRSIIDDARHEKIRGLATKMARMHGKLIGVDLQLQAEAAWNTFIANEGWFSTFDVDEYWSDRDDGDWEETWTLAYSAEAERMEREKVAPCKPEEV